MDTEEIDNSVSEEVGNKSVYYSAPGTPTGIASSEATLNIKSPNTSIYHDAMAASEEPMDCTENADPSATLHSAGSGQSTSINVGPVSLEAESISSDPDGVQLPSDMNVYEHISSDETDQDSAIKSGSAGHPNVDKNTKLMSTEVDDKVNENYPQSPSSDGEIDEGANETDINSTGLEPISPDSNLSGMNSPYKDNSSGCIDDEDDDFLDLVSNQPESSHNRNGSGKRPVATGSSSTLKASDEKLAQSKVTLHDDHGELDYEEEVVDEATKEIKSEQKGEKDDAQQFASKKAEDNEKSDEGELSDEGSEEGEIKESGATKKQAFVPKSLCRFYNRGQCTWGHNCRFLHPGVNDKGNYSLIEQQNPQMNLGPPSMRGRIGPYVPEFNNQPEPELIPPPPSPPAAETAWERGLRHAKELRKKANKRREAEPDFEDKRLHLRVDADVENKENDRHKASRDPSYEQPYEEEIYNKGAEAWHDGQYENFEVRWSRDTEFREYRGDLRDRMRDRGHERWEHTDDRKQFRRREDKFERSFPEKIDKRFEKPVDKPNRPTKERANPGITEPSKRPPRADEWNDPWSRAKSPKNKRAGSRSRSRSRGRRRHRSGSSYSSYSSSSYSSRSRSSSFSSYSSRSSFSRSSSRSASRSRSRSRPDPKNANKKPSKTSVNLDKKPPSKHGDREAPKSAVMKAGMGNEKRPEKSAAIHKPSPGNVKPSHTQQNRSAKRPSPTKPSAKSTSNKSSKTSKESNNDKGVAPVKGPQPLPKLAPVVKQSVKQEPPGSSANAPPPGRGNKSGMVERGRKRERFPPSGRSKKRTTSGTSSNSSSSRSPSTSRSLSVSSISSTVSSVSSSGSADSEHLYRDIGSPSKKSGKSKKGVSGIVKHDKTTHSGKSGRQNVEKDTRVSQSKDRRDRPGDRRPRDRLSAPYSFDKGGMHGKTNPQIQQSKAKDPMKMAGHKSSIKLTLRSDKAAGDSNSGKKRMATESGSAPSPKKPLLKPNEPTKAPVRITLPKKEKLVPTSLSPKKDEKSPSKGGKASGTSGGSKKKSMSSRREELLQQLKAVEDAIARKRAKMN